MIKKKELGKVIGTLGNYTIRQVFKYVGTGKDRKVESTTIAVYHVKKLIQDGFKSTKIALEYAQTLMK